MKKKLDDRVQEEMDRAAMKEQAQKYLTKMWGFITGRRDLMMIDEER